MKPSKCRLANHTPTGAGAFSSTALQVRKQEPPSLVLCFVPWFLWLSVLDVLAMFSVHRLGNFKASLMMIWSFGRVLRGMGFAFWSCLASKTKRKGGGVLPRRTGSGCLSNLTAAISSRGVSKETYGAP